LKELVQQLQYLRDPSLVDLEGVIIIIAEHGEAERALLLQCVCKAVLQTLRVVVVDLCNNVENQQALKNIHILRRHANNYHVNSLYANGNKDLHECNQNHRDASVPAARAV
jgi:hypothetical protein